MLGAMRIPSRADSSEQRRKQIQPYRNSGFDNKQHDKEIIAHTRFLPKESVGLSENSVVLTEQIYTIDKARLFGFVGHLSTELYEKVDKALSLSLAISAEQGKEKGYVFQEQDARANIS